LRFRVHLAEHFEVDANQVEAPVIGEHGVSQVFLWSSARIAGVPISTLIERRGETLDSVRKPIEQSVRYANITIIEGNEASQFGIGIVSARIAEIIVRDERAVIPIGSYNEKFGVTLSLPVDHEDLRAPGRQLHLQLWSTQAFGCSPRSWASEG
jgi:L-lactate dehydrogenase